MRMLPAVAGALVLLYPAASHAANAIPTPAPAVARDLVTSPTASLNSSLWRFPELRASFREYTRLSRQARLLERDAATTTTLPRWTSPALGGRPDGMALAGLIACREVETTPTLSAERIEALGALARAGLRRNPNPWGGEVFWNVFLNPRAFRRPDALPNHLLDQQGSDDVPGNATAATEFFYVGLQEDPERYLPVLLERLREPSLSEQQRFLRLSLLLHYTVRNDATYTASSWQGEWAPAGSQAGNYYRLAEDDRRTVRDAMVAVLSDLSLSRDYETQDHSLRSTVWLLFQTIEPFPRAEAALLLEKHWYRYRAERLALVMLLRDPALLLGDREVLENLFWYSSSLDALEPYTISHRYDEPDDLLREAAAYYLRHPFPDLEARIERALDVREALLAAVREAIPSASSPSAQMNMARFLVRAQGDENLEAAALVSIANLGCDDEPFNSGAAASLIDQLPETEHADLAETALVAGYHLALESGDWQMMAQCLEGLSWRSREFHALAADPRAVRLAVAQLVDDEIPWNATFGRRAILAMGEASLPELRRLARDGNEEDSRNARWMLRIHFGEVIEDPAPQSVP